MRLASVDSRLLILSLVVKPDSMRIFCAKYSHSVCIAIGHLSQCLTDILYIFKQPFLAFVKSQF